MSVVAIASTDPHAASGRAGTHAVPVGALVTGAVVAGGLVGATPLPTLGWAAAFLFCAVVSDVRTQRIPNWLTLPSFAAVLVATALVGGTGALGTALLGAGTAFGLLLLPYALGGLGAGDVKAAMVLGAWLGPAGAFALVAAALAVGALLALASLLARRALGSTLRRVWSTFVVAVVTRRPPSFEPTGSAGAGIPFAVALGLAFAALPLRELLQ